MQSKIMKIEDDESECNSYIDSVLMRSKVRFLINILVKINDLPDDRKNEIGYNQAEVQECIDGLSKL